MNPLLWIALVTAGIALSLWLPRWRLKRALAKPLPAEGLAVLESNIPVYRHMPAPLQEQLRHLVVQFLYQKKFVGCGGLEMTDEMRYTIAGQACLLLLNRQTQVYPELDTILVYPNEFIVTRDEVGPGGVVTPSANGLLGESWGDGRVVLAWDHVQRGAADWTDGQNVVLHEFAHQLDSESGAANGAPYLPSVSSYRSWATVLSRDFDKLRHDAMVQQQSVMDHYGATNPAEFFAVATETFFEKPYQMAEHHEELYAQFLQYYKVDPRDWMAPPVEPEHMASPFPNFAQHW
ncbi:zinc-dependent peptidase [Janthinobacterium sp. UMAB-56]|uniref:M90 family metallopeptidase n=1 Tax=Janthinobacterium sp. UMAB-56 TaxID=1365361 RepID=UPI001C55EEAE|nr:M90 family metallopeptidase [Janthinobacterium sp. UMAB-56]